MERIEKAERCPGCGTKPGDVFDDAGFPVEEPAYIVTVEECAVCERVALEQAGLRGAEKPPAGAGKRVVIVPNDDLPPDASADGTGY